MTKVKKVAQKNMIKTQLLRADKAISSATAGMDEKFKKLGTKILQPEYSFSSLIDIYELSTIANKSIELVAKNTAYTGRSIEKKEDVSDADYEFVNEFIKNINPEKNLEDIIHDMVIDLKTTGNGAWEIVRNQFNKPEGLYNIPIDTIRPAVGTDDFRTGQRYVQVFDDTGSNYTWYNKYYPNEENRSKDFGYNPKINTTGPTNDCLWFKLPNPKSLFFGLSPSVTLLKDYLIGKYIQDYNIAEFESGFLNKFAIIIEGGVITPQSMEAVKEYIGNIKENGDWNAVPVIHAPTGKIKIEKLGDSIRDGSYLALSDKINELIIIAFGVPPVLLGISEGSNRSTAIEQSKKFHENEIRPLQRKIEKIMNTIINIDLGIVGVEFKFGKPDFRDLDKESEIGDKAIKEGVMSINEYRNMLGLSSLVDEDGNPLEGAEKTYIRSNGMTLFDVSKLGDFDDNGVIHFDPDKYTESNVTASDEEKKDEVNDTKE